MQLRQLWQMLEQNFNRSPSSPPLIQQPDRNEERFATGGFCEKLTNDGEPLITQVLPLNTSFGRLSFFLNSGAFSFEAHRYFNCFQSVYAKMTA